MDEKMPPPVPESGRFVGPMTDERGIVRKHKLPLGKAESLAALLDEYVFFTPASMYLHGRFFDGPLIDMMWEVQRDIPLYHYKFNRQLFYGLEAKDGDPAWNYVLWAVRPDDFDAVRKFILSVTLSWANEKRIICYGEQAFRVLDPLVVAKPLIGTEMPTIPISAFGVNGNRMRTAFSLDEDIPRLKRLPPDIEMVVCGDAVFGGENPCNARQDFREALKRKEADHQQEDGDKNG